MIVRASRQRMLPSPNRRQPSMSCLLNIAEGLAGLAAEERSDLALGKGKQGIFSGVFKEVFFFLNAGDKIVRELFWKG